MAQQPGAAFRGEMGIACDLYAGGDFAGAFRRFERAHILGQRNLIPHLLSHWWMLKVAIRTVDGREICGQMLRGFAVFLGYAFDWIPVGNTGGANVSALKPMPLPTEFQQYFDGYDAGRRLRRRLLVLAMLGVVVGASALASRSQFNTGETLQGAR